MPEYFKSTSSKPADTKVEKYRGGGKVPTGTGAGIPGEGKRKRMKAGGQVPKTVARGSGAARIQYFRKNG
tara:strand:+ start:2495 stop:2704 length:210 start_codon:yes stop_codon:yes gene_type:complete